MRHALTRTIAIAVATLVGCAVQCGAQVAPMPQQAPGGIGQLKPGMRVTYYMGSASVPGVRTTLVQDDQGNWINQQTGQRFAEADNPGSAGAGYHVLNVVAADGRDIAVDVRNYVLMDPQQGLSLTTSISAYVGTPDGMGDFWQPPAKLAQMQEQDAGGLRIRRMAYPVGQRTFNAITITNTAGGGFTRHVYDLETGLLVAASSSTTGAGQLAPNGIGGAGVGAGVTTITSTRLIDVRELKLPWAAQQLPEFLRTGANLDYAGTYETRMPGAPAMAPSQVQARLALGERRDGWVPARQLMRTDTGVGGPPRESASDRAFGTMSCDPLWIDPQVLARLQPDTVIDADPITRRRITYLGQQNNLAILVEQAPYEQATYGYDPRSGLLVAIQQQTQQGPATLVTTLQLTRQP